MKRVHEVERFGALQSRTDTELTILVQPEVACQGCAARAGCGPGRARRMTLPIGALHSVDDLNGPHDGSVRLALPHGALFRLIVHSHLLPALLTLLGAAAGAALSDGDAGALCGALCGLGLGYLGLKRYHAPRALEVVYAGVGESGSGASNLGS